MAIGSAMIARPKESSQNQSMSVQIYLDESGYTGPDLINVDQPFFVVASTTVNNADAAKLLQQAFPKYQADEFKFKQIWKYAGHRNQFPVLCSNIERRC